MGAALALAADAGDDVPIGAVVLGPDGGVVGQGMNRREADGDPTGHAEIVAIRGAARALGAWRLEGCTLVVTLEPCTMCAGAIVLARLDRVVFGAWDPKAGAAGSIRDVLLDNENYEDCPLFKRLHRDIEQYMVRTIWRMKQQGEVPASETIFSIARSFRRR